MTQTLEIKKNFSYTKVAFEVLAGLCSGFAVSPLNAIMDKCVI